MHTAPAARAGAAAGDIPASGTDPAAQAGAPGPASAADKHSRPAHPGPARASGSTGAAQAADCYSPADFQTADKSFFFDLFFGVDFSRFCFL